MPSFQDVARAYVPRPRRPASSGPGYFDTPVQGGQVRTAAAGPYGGLGRKFGRAGEVFTRQLYGEAPERYGRAQRAYGRYEGYLDDPTAAGRQFQDFFGEAARGISDPAMRDFSQQLAGVQGSTAARFGGNASSEESRNVYNTSDLFSRNLSDDLARLAPQAAGMGMEYGNQLGAAAHGAVNEQDQLSQMILAGIVGNKKKGFDWGKLLGQLGGAAIGTLIAPGVGTMAGAQAGGGL